MRFSVIIPTLNEADQIEAAIDSARQAGAAEIIVADGGSVDSTTQLASQMGAILVVSPAGRGVQMNRGAAAATGDILVFLHADNRLTPAAGNQLAQAFESGKQFCCFRQRIESSHWLYRWIERGNAFRATAQKLPYGDQAISISRELFEQVGGYDEIPLMEDVQLARKVIRSNPPNLLDGPVLLDGPLLVSDRRWKKNGIVRQTIANWWTMMRFRLGASPIQLARSYQRSDGKSSQRLHPADNEIPRKMAS